MKRAARLAARLLLLPLAAVFALPGHAVLTKESSRARVRESSPPASLATTRADAVGLPASLAPAAADDVDEAELPPFNLGDVVLVERELAREERFHLGPLTLVDLNLLRGPPSSYPETRVGGFELLPPFRLGASASLSLWSRQACGFSCREAVSDSRQDPWGLESGGAFGAIDRRDRGITNPIAGTIDVEAVAREAAATAVEELSYVGIANGLTSSLLGYDFVRKEEVKGPLARILAGISVVPGIPATIRKIDEIPGLKNAAKFDLPGGTPGTVGNWVEGLKRWDTPTAKRSGLFEVEQTGPFNFRVHGGGEKVDIDGFLDTTVLDAKFVDKPNVSPFVPGSDIKPEIRKVIHDKVRNEFRRLSAVIADPSVPFRRLEVRVNDPKAAPFFESLMSEYGIPGGVNIVETGVKRKGAP